MDQTMFGCRFPVGYVPSPPDQNPTCNMIQTWSELAQDTAEDHMPQEILTRLAGHVAVHPWWQARARLVSRLIHDRLGAGPWRVLDVGCGWGVTLEYLEQAGHTVVGMDVGRPALEKLDRPDRTLILGDVENGPIPQSAWGQYDVVLALDVLEHLDNDTAALEHLAQLARQGGLVVVSVPALPRLWSEFDQVQGHRRRYVKADLQRLFAANPLLHEAQIGYCWPWLIPLARWSRRKSGRASGKADLKPWQVYEQYVRPAPWPVRQAMSLLFRMSERFILAGGQTSGTSLLASAHKC